ncbi:MAG TPA: GNAT family N-acetyltransferase [Candidatus Scatomorpha stercoravium]|nr:GNAT family N-acetyltransferase [Candidatus Scatomorpha stercoravium]
MRIYEAAERTEELVRELLGGFVRATHLFLSDGEVRSIREYVPQALLGVAHLLVAKDEAGAPAAFMGVEDGALEMLFIDPEERGKGLGRRLLRLGIESYGVRRLAVNEQNPRAAGFYEHMGFEAYARSETDEQGNPYPILYMRLA